MPWIGVKKHLVGLQYHTVKKLRLTLMGDCF